MVRSAEPSGYSSVQIPQGFSEIPQGFGGIPQGFGGPHPWAWCQTDSHRSIAYNLTKLFDNWGRMVSTGQARLVVARRGRTLASLNHVQNHKCQRQQCPWSDRLRAGPPRGLILAARPAAERLRPRRGEQSAGWSRDDALASRDEKTPGLAGAEGVAARRHGEIKPATTRVEAAIRLSRHGGSTPPGSIFHL